MLENYTTAELKLKDLKEAGKTEISNEAYSVCEFLQALINELRKN